MSRALQAPSAEDQPSPRRELVIVESQVVRGMLRTPVLLNARYFGELEEWFGSLHFPGDVPTIVSGEITTLALGKLAQHAKEPPFLRTPVEVLGFPLEGWTLVRSIMT